MLNYIWLGLMVAAVIIGGCTGQLKEVADKGLEWANLAVVSIAFALIGIMALWLGIMRLAERAGLVALLARVLRPVLRLVFPEIPAGRWPRRFISSAVFGTASGSLWPQSQAQLSQMRCAP